MKKSQSPPSAAGLRARAEERLRRPSPKGAAQRTEAETARLVHELAVHQIELEMQNEELREAHARESTLAAEYAELYDFGPSGYLNLDREGAIRRMNLTGARLVGIEREFLVNQRFDTFVAESDCPAFRVFLQKVFAGSAKEICEVAPQPKGLPLIQVWIEGVVSADGEECPRCRFTWGASELAPRRKRESTPFDRDQVPVLVLAADCSTDGTES